MNRAATKYPGWSIVRGAKTPMKTADTTLRDGTTGQAVLHRVWAVGETESPAEVRPWTMVHSATDAHVRPRPELAFYRKYTEAMLRRYLRLSMSTGRLPSLLGRELFRSKVTSYRVHNFEDVVIFCIDVERCLQKLTHDEQQVIKRIALQEYSQGEAAGLLGLSLRDTVRKYGAALDRLTGILLAARMLEPLRAMAEVVEQQSE